MTELEANGGGLLSRVLGSYEVLRGNRNLRLLFGGQLISNPHVVFDLVGARAGHLNGVAEAAADIDGIERVGDARQVQVRTNSFRVAFGSAASVLVGEGFVGPTVT
jgi:hypothetical protein